MEIWAVSKRFREKIEKTITTTTNETINTFLGASTKRISKVD
jgi:hypothetical protein